MKTHGDRWRTWSLLYYHKASSQPRCATFTLRTSLSISSASLMWCSQPVFAREALDPLQPLWESKTQIEDWPLHLQCIYNFTMPIQCSSGSVIWAASTCLCRCFQQSLCLHCWNIRFYQESICNTHTHTYICVCVSFFYYNLKWNLYCTIWTTM